MNIFLKRLQNKILKIEYYRLLTDNPSDLLDALLRTSFESKLIIFNNQFNFKSQGVNMLRKKTPFCFLILLVCAFKLALSYPATAQSSKETNSSSSFEKTVSAGDEHRNGKFTEFDASRQIVNNMYHRAAIENDMNPAAVEEAVRTGKPVIKVENNENGTKRTTTYTLQPDGSISRHIKTEYRPSIVVSPTLLNKSHNIQPMFLPNSSSEKQNDWEWNPRSMPRVGAHPSYSSETPKWTQNWQVPSFKNINRNQDPQIPKENPTQIHWTGLTSTTPLDTLNGIDNRNSGTTTKTFLNGDNTKITTVHTVGPTEWHTKSITFPYSEFDFTKTNTTTIPSLEDFLRSQYGITTKNIAAPQDPVGTTPFFPQKPSTESKFVTTININDLPISEIVNTNELAHSQTPITPDLKSHTKAFTRTIQSIGVPRATNLDPNMKEILDRAGISPTDAFASPDGTITKTRTDPDGKVITTTYRIRTVPAETTLGDGSNNVFNIMESERPLGPFLVKEKPRKTFDTQQSTTSLSNIPNINGSFGTRPAVPEHESRINSVTRSQNNKNPIDEFLAKINLSAEMLKTANGEIIKTIIDNNGRVLTSTFVLSTVRNDDNHLKNKADNMPIKRIT